jgi:hypothetical protein
MKKVMVVTNDRIVGESLLRVLRALGNKVILVDHNNALSSFLIEEPEVTFILEYSEIGDKLEDYNIGRQTYQDIINSATEEQRIIRCGVEDYPYSDYLKIPFVLDDLNKFLV